MLRIVEACVRTRRDALPYASSGRTHHSSLRTIVLYDLEHRSADSTLATVAGVPARVQFESRFNVGETSGQTLNGDGHPVWKGADFHHVLAERGMHFADLV